MYIQGSARVKVVVSTSRYFFMRKDIKEYSALQWHCHEIIHMSSEVKTDSKLLQNKNTQEQVLPIGEARKIRHNVKVPIYFLVV